MTAITSLRDLPERLSRKVTVVRAGYRSACWEWTAYRDRDGYPQCRWEGRMCRVHRLVYLFMHDEIKFEINHLCRNRACIRPSHLEDRPHIENVRYSLRLTCRQGHRFTTRNTIRRKNGKRDCRTCKRQWDHEYYARNKVSP